MRLALAATASLSALTTTALAGEVRQVEHGMIVTTDAGEEVRILAFEDGSFRVTIARDVADAADSLMVIAEADGAPRFALNEGWASLTSSGGTAMVQVSDGRLVVYGREGEMLLDENAAARSITPVELEGQEWFATRVQFNRGTDEGLYGLGQHQNRQMNYNGEDVELAQHNMAIAVPYLVSTRGYGLLWDNNSITRVGDPELYAKLALDWRADYYLGDRQVVSRAEETVDYQYIRDQKRWPAAATAAVESATTGQNTAGNSLEEQRVVWTGSFTPETSGTHKFRLYSSSYVTVTADGEEVLRRWRQNWNPWYHNFELELTAGEPIELQIEWEPNQGYIALEHADPIFDADRHSVSFASEAGKAIDYYVVPAPSMDDAIAGYRRLTGRAPMMPEWAFGFWQSRQRYNTQVELLDVVSAYRDTGIPIDNIVQDWFYWPEDSWGCHCFDPVRFPDPSAMVREVHEQDARIMISVWPKFYPATDHARELAAGGYLYERPLEAGQLDWVGPGYPNTFYDPYTPEARGIYWRQMRDTLLPLGFDAWWMDATEPDWHSNLSIEERKYQMTSPATGVPGAAIFNSYPLPHAEGVAEGLREAQPDRRPFILTRSGFGGVQRASAALWSGDVAARWDDLRDQISAGLNLSLAGVPHWTHDIGGFSLEDRYSREDPDHLPEWRELYTRWFQFGAFTPLFRSHGEFPHRETPIIAADDPAMLESLTYYHRLRYVLMPYIYTVAAGTHFDDGTIMRPLVMDFEADRATWDIDDQYLFGPALLVAPVTEFEVRERQLYLPAGAEWIDANHGRRLAGGQTVTVAAPRERMPLFVRAGAIVPTGPVIQSTAQDTGGVLNVHVFAGADGSFTLYEDEGTDMGYRDGEFSRVPLTWDESARTLVIGERMGSFPGMHEAREIGVVVHDGDGGGSVFSEEPTRTIAYDGEAVELYLP
ncbi:TIM-barrel domain-containing protein [Aurantiacibacter poecillastricola]|uniref:TIM-barrel domain-containing protein n=1 Tax=Aurantiacibacter poecillastricola TaxID=3064385 RepID=UPI00273F4196|nr:TIM-barrel domain-containing protein [Aurantiacibacter sp. 219JJ12-13]MDP5263072.1 glycoside hydrolase family 31 protein [Aurantiacibacter sp. 219JJ12-13]